MNNLVFCKTMVNLRNCRGDDQQELRERQDPKAGGKSLKCEAWGIRQRPGRHPHVQNVSVPGQANLHMKILENSKILMYDFLYNQMKAQYSQKCELIYTDSNGRLMEIETEDVYRDEAEDLFHYDRSNYPEEHPLYCSENKKVLDKMKRRVRRESHQRSRRHPQSLKKKKTSRRQREWKKCGKKRDPAWAIQKGIVWEKAVFSRDEHPEKQGPRHLRHAHGQGLSVGIRHEAVNRRQWLHTLAYGHKKIREV